MGWLFVQVWILCVVAFLAGSALTWLVFVRPRRGAEPAGGPLWTPVPAWATGRGPAIREPAPPPAPFVATAGPAVDPALAALDIRGPERPPAGLGVTASGALDHLGVADAVPAEIGIPTQAVPVDSPDPGTHDRGRP